MMWCWIKLKIGETLEYELSNGIHTIFVKNLNGKSNKETFQINSNNEININISVNTISGIPKIIINTVNVSRDINVQELLDLKKLLDADIITQEEFNEKKEKYLNNSESSLKDNIYTKINRHSKKKKKNKFVEFIIICISVIVFLFLFLVTIIWNYTENPRINLNKFNQIQTGMTYEEVVNIIGEEGTVMSEVDMDIGEEYKTIIYYWYGFDGISNANVTFQGGKVIAKNQIGLE